MRSLLLTTALLLATAPVPAIADAPPSGQRGPGAAVLAEVVPHWMAAARIRGAAIAHIRDGRIASLQVYGERAPGVPLTADAEFNVASLTKPVFATLTLQLVAQGKLGLDSPLAEHWVDPDIASDERRLALTPRLTLSHQSGFPNWRSDKLSFDFAPGARHEYSGEGYEYTRKAIEGLTGQKLGELMQAQVLSKAGMSHSYFGWNAAIAGREVTGYDQAGQPLDMADLKQREPNAAAHLFTTIGDYARFTQWLLDGAGLPPALRAEMARPQARHENPAEYFGLGWRIVRVGAESVLSHDGRERGVRTQVFVLPDSREALVIFTNSDQGELLVNPVVEATLGKGRALVQQVGVDTWHYLRSMPPQAIGPMSQGITRSPSFMSKLLYAVDATLVADAGLTFGERQEARRAIDAFVLGMVEGKVSPDVAKQAFGLLLETEAGQARLRSRFGAAEARAWVRNLQAAAGGSAG